MPTIRFEASCPGESGGATSAIGARIEDVRLAVSLLVGAASKAEEALASSGVAGRAGTHWSHEALAAAGPLGRIIRSCNELETALAGRGSPVVNMPQMPSPATLKTIAAVEAARAAMPDERTQATIATVEAVRASMPSLDVRKAINAVAAADAAFERSDHADALAKTHQPFFNL
jgi:hypothetical protein